MLGIWQLRRLGTAFAVKGPGSERIWWNGMYWDLGNKSKGRGTPFKGPH